MLMIKVAGKKLNHFEMMPTDYFLCPLSVATWTMILQILATPAKIRSNNGSRVIKLVSFSRQSSFVTV